GKLVHSGNAGRARADYAAGGAAAAAAGQRRDHPTAHFAVGRRARTTDRSDTDAGRSARHTGRATARIIAGEGAPKMANHPQTVTSHPLPRVGLMAALVASFAGCAPLAPFVAPLAPVVAPVNEPPKPSLDCCQAVAQWSKRVHYEPDPTH